MELYQKTLTYFPFAVDLKRKNVLVVGGGKVAERKVLALLKAGAYVKIISPDVTSVLKNLAGKSQVEWEQKRIKQADLRGIRLIIAATNDKNINEQVSRWAKDMDIWVNVVDKPVLSDFISPAVFFAEEGIVSVYSDGKDPVLSRDLKNFIGNHWNEFISYRNKLPVSTG